MRHILCSLLMMIGAASAAAAQIDPDLRQALREADPTALQAALDAGADPNAVGESALAETPLMLAASLPDPAYARILLEAGAEIDTQDANGDPAVNWAAYYGHFDTIGFLANAGADLELTGHGNARQILMRRGFQRPLEAVIAFQGLAPERSIEEIGVDAALSAGAPEMLEPYLDWDGLAGARDRVGRPALQTAARNNRGAAIETMAAAGYPVDATDEIGFTALMEAAREGAIDAVEALIAAGADVNHVAEPTGLSMTPLHLAGIGGNILIVDALIEAGAEVDARDATGATPALWAAFEGQRATVVRLIDAGADPYLENPDGISLATAFPLLGWTDLAAEYPVESE